MQKVRTILKNLLPDFLIRYRHKIQVRKGLLHRASWSGDYSSWEQAEGECEGYDKGNILEKVLDSAMKVKRGEAAYERDSVAFPVLEYSPYLLKTLQEVLNEKEGKLDVLDFGGSLGSTYFQYKNLLNNIHSVNWSVVEQQHFVEKGNSFIAGEGLHFYASLEEAIRVNQPSILLLCSVLSYIEQPYNLLESLLRINIPVIIVDRTGFISGRKERLTKQTVPEYIYSASYPAWFFNEKEWRSFVEDHGYLITEEHDSEFAHPLRLDDGYRVYWKGFVLRKTSERGGVS